MFRRKPNKLTNDVKINKERLLFLAKTQINLLFTHDFKILRKKGLKKISKYIIICIGEIVRQWIIAYYLNLYVLKISVYLFGGCVLLLSGLPQNVQKYIISGHL